MSCKIYVVRHGQSMGNLINTFLGHTDLDLSPLGYTQAQYTAEFLADKSIEKIYASDLLRAYNTSMPLARKLNIIPEKHKGFREIYAGDWENKTFEHLHNNYYDSFKNWLENISTAKIPNGESVKELYDRITENLISVAKENDGKTIAIFTHATPIRVMNCFCNHLPIEEMQNIGWCSNASVSTIIYDNGEFTMTSYGEDSFLGDMVTAFPKNI